MFLVLYGILMPLHGIALNVGEKVVQKVARIGET